MKKKTKLEESVAQLEKKQENKNIFFYSLIAVLLGLLALTIICIIDIRFSVDAEMHKIFFDYIKPLVTNIANSAIILGTGTLLIDLFGYLSYFRKRLSEVFTEQQIVDILNDDYKKELMVRLLKSIYKPNTDDSEKLISLFDGRLNAIMDTYYYSSYSFFCDCSIINFGDVKCFEKKIEKVVTYKEVNNQNTNEIEVILRLLCPCINTSSDESIQYFDDISVVVEGKKLKCGRDTDKCAEGEFDVIIHSDVIDDDVTGKQKTLYTCKFSKKYEIKNELHIELKYKTIVPIDDREYTVHMDHLCKNMRCKFSYNIDEMDVGVKGFNFSTDPKTGFKDVNHKGLCEIESQDWVLPGEGVEFSIFEKT